MKISRLAPVPLAVLCAVAGVLLARESTPFRGTFTVAPSDLPGTVELRIEQRSAGHHMSSSFDLPAAELRGWSEAADGPTRFELARDAGTLICEGTLRRGEGGGSALLTPSADYLAEMSRLGYGDVSGRMFSLFVHDVSRPFIRELASLGYAKVGLEDLIRLRIHGATPAFVREMQALGYAHPEIEDLIRLRIHGATPDYVRRLEELGYTRLALEDLVRFRIHGVSPEYVSGLRELGYANLDAEDLVRFRIHGVSPEMVRDLKSLGYERIPAEDLVRMRIHGVTPAYVQSFQRDGYERIAIEDLISMRIHGVTPELAHAARGH